MKPFSLLVKPASADCNLRCTYCFYLGRSALYPETRVHRMSEAVLERMVQSYMATRQPAYSFGWQGGEPTLMGVDFFRKVTEFQQKYGAAGSRVSNGLQTNGTLITEELAEHLARYHFLVGVSLDGPQPVHDRFRRSPGGQGSHAEVLKGISRLREHRVEFNILTLVSRSNVAQPKEIYRYLCDQGFLYHQYIECVEFDAKGGLQPFAVSGPEWGDFLCGIYDEWHPRDTRRVSVRLFDSIVARMVLGDANVCAMSDDCRQYFVVEHNGDVYPCDFFVRRDLRLGNVRDGSWEAFAESSAYREFGRRKRDWNAACANCEYLRFCGGCCPKNRSAEGRDPKRLSVLCEGWRAFFRHTLEGFRHLADEVWAERQHAEAAGPEEETPKIRRNDPCPCGSGRKYKKCCGAAETQGGGSIADPAKGLDRKARELVIGGRTSPTGRE
jgi:uncharacterized protein